MTGLLSRVPAALRLSLTWGQGNEMALHKTLADRSGIEIYFADPHSPWQRPTDENGNGIIRRYVGKRTDPSIYQPPDLRATAKHVYDQAVAMTT